MFHFIVRVLKILLFYRSKLWNIHTIGAQPALSTTDTLRTATAVRFARGFHIQQSLVTDVRFEKSESVKRGLTEVCSNYKFDGLLIEQEKLTSSSTPTEESLCLLQKVTSVFELNADTYSEKSLQWNTGVILAYWREWDAYQFFSLLRRTERHYSTEYRCCPGYSQSEGSPGCPKGMCSQLILLSWFCFSFDELRWRGKGRGQGHE